MTFPPYSEPPSEPYPSTSPPASWNTLKREPQPTTWPTGFVGLGIPSQPQPSSERDRALLLLNEAYNAVSAMEQGRVTGIAKTKIEEAELWLRTVRP